MQHWPRRLATRLMIDAVFATARRPAFKASKLPPQGLIVQWRGGSRIDQRQHILVDLAFRVLGCFIDHTPPSEGLDAPLARISVAVNAVDLILTEDRTNLLNYGLGGKWCAPFSDYVEHAAVTLFVT